MAHRRHRAPNRTATRIATRARQHALSTPPADTAVVANVVPAPRQATDPGPASPALVPAVVVEVGLGRLAQLVVEEQRLKEERAELVDHLAARGVGWPAIAAVLGMSRQAARQAHRRRHTPAAASARAARAARVDP